MRLTLVPDHMNTPLEEKHFYAAAVTLMSEGWSAVYPDTNGKTIVLHDDRIETLKSEMEEWKRNHEPK